MGACKAIGSSWFLSENRLSALHLPKVSALKSQLWCQVAVVCIPHNGSPHAKLQLVLQVDFPKNKAAHWEICPHSGFGKVSERGFFQKKISFVIRFPKEMEMQFSLQLYRG